MKKSVRILLVDDDPDFAQAMAFWLESRGYSVTLVLNGEDAIRTIKENTPDIVFLDIVMPHMDGYTVLKLVREFNETLPVIMMSAYEKEEKVKRKVNFYGVSSFFDKGDNFSKAMALLESALH